MLKQKDLNSFLLNVVRSIFDEVDTMDVVIEKIMVRHYRAVIRLNITATKNLIDDLRQRKSKNADLVHFWIRSVVTNYD